MTRLDWLLLGAALVFAAALGWFYREAAVEDCAGLVHRDLALCSQLGGNLDAEGDDSTVCVFRCTYPP